MTLLFIILILLLLFGGGGYYYGPRNAWGPTAYGGLGFVLLLIIVLLLFASPWAVRL
jgi:hypothetical protein